MAQSPVERPLLLMVRTGNRKFREYLFTSIATQFRIHMVLGVEPTWEVEYLTGWTVQTNTLDTPALIAIARDVNAATPIDGVLCWDESRIPQAAAIAADLGLAGASPQAVAACRDKHQTRLLLGAAGVPQPRSVRVDTVETALAEADRIGYPVVIKPSDLALSLGVVKVDNPEQLRSLFTFTASTRALEIADYQPRVLLEEYVDGEEISVDAAVYQGEVYPLCLARKEIGFAPYCVEVGHYVHGDDPLLGDPQLIDILRHTHKALGFTDGVTHTELKLGSAGPKVIEVNGRLGGDMIPYLGLRATGVDVGLAAARVACGRPPQVNPTHAMVAGIRFFYPTATATRIESVEFAQPESLPNTIDRLVVLAEPGSVKSPPPDGTRDGRIAFATAVAGTAAESRQALDAAQAALRLNGAPL